MSKFKKFVSCGFMFCMLLTQYVGSLQFVCRAELLETVEEDNIQTSETLEEDGVSIDISEPSTAEDDVSETPSVTIEGDNYYYSYYTCNSKFDNAARACLFDIAREAGLMEEDIDKLWNYFKDEEQWWNDEHIKCDIKFYREFRNFWLENYARVTNVYSVNNSLPNAYYRPLLKDLPGLEAFVISAADLLTAYTGFFDLNNTGVYTDSHGLGPEYIGNVTLTRALDVLGTDFLLSSESAEYNANTTEWVYKPILSEDNPTFSTVIMDIYKALNIVYTDVSIQFVGDVDYNILSSPASKDILASGNATKVDPFFVYCYVYATRTNPLLYAYKAQSDLKIQMFEQGSTTVLSSLAYSKISNRDFVILLSNMMNLYGEPVLSDKEMKLLLQVYGATIPINESQELQEAYVYLKARGVLNVELDWDAPLVMEDMLDILMCVADSDSRTNWKEIQPVYTIDDDLMNAGYFAADVQLQIVKSDVVLDAISYKYDEAVYYDYYIEFQNEGTSPIFYNQDGTVPREEVFFPAFPGVPEGPVLEGSMYLGIVVSEGKSYYHLRAPIDMSNSRYNTAEWNGYIQLNTPVDTDYPRNITMEVGGGVYTYNAQNNTLSRREFKDDEFEGAVSIGRIEQTEELDTVGFLDSLRQFCVEKLFKPRTASASHRELNTSRFGHNSPDTTYTFTDSSGNEKTFEAKDLFTTMKLEGNIDSTDAEYIQAILKLSTSRESGEPVYEGILIDVYTLVDLGLITQETADNLSYSEVDNDILSINTKYGTVVLDNSEYSKTITKGNSIMRLPDDTVLFVFDTAGENSANPQRKLIDIRVLLGWSANNVLVVSTKDESGIKLTLARANAGSTGLVRNLSVCLPKEHITSTKSVVDYTVQAIPRGAIGITDLSINPTLVTSPNVYSNYFIYEEYDKTTRAVNAYAVVFYIKEVIESRMNVNSPDGSLSYTTNITLDDIGLRSDIIEQFKDIWVYKVFPLDYGQEFSPGKFVYFKGYGWLYCTPDRNTVSDDLEKYLDGEYILPLFYNKALGCVEDWNVNLYKKGDFTYTYGSFSVVSAMDGSRSLVPAPVGVINFVSRKGLTTTQVLNAGNWDNTVLRLGSLLVEWDKKDRVFKTYIPAVDSEVVIDLGNATLYKVASILEHVYDPNSLTNYYATGNRQIIMNMVTDSTVEEELDTEVDITYPEQDEIDSVRDQYREKEKFSLENSISSFDELISVLIVTATLVIPLVGYTLTIMLAGLAIMADNRIVQGLSDRTIDLVKILTFGQKTIHTITLRNSFVSIILGVIVFTLLLDGNLIKLIEYGLEVFTHLTRAIRMS